MAADMITSVSRDGTAAQAPMPVARKRGFFGRVFSCFTLKERAPAPPQSILASEEALLPPLLEKDKGKKCLVLDLDETLVHSSARPVPNADYIIPVEIEGQIHQFYVLKRPGVDQFLRYMAEWFEVVVFTASVAPYADPVLDLLDVHKGVQHRLFRESCSNHRGNYVKDLARLGRPLKDVIIIDNSPASYIFHPENAVPIDSWFDDRTDTELLDLVPFLQELSKVNDVRSVLDSQRG